MVVFHCAISASEIFCPSARNGYHLAFWRVGNLVYCAVSDTAWGELIGLVRLLQDMSTGDAG